MLLTIVIPCFNVGSLVKDCLDSCINISYSEIFEIIIVNDGSTDDDTIAALNSISKKNEKNIKIINQENKGLSGARNTGIDFSNGKYIWFVDGDDSISPDFFEYFFSLKLNFDIFCFEANFIGSENNYRESRFFVEGEITDINNFKLKGIWNNIFKKTFLIDNELYFKEGLLHEDFEYLSRSFYLAKDIIYCKNQFYNYKVSRLNSITNNVKLKNCLDLLHTSNHIYQFLETIHERSSFLISRLNLSVTYAVHNSKNLSLKERKVFFDYLLLTISKTPFKFISNYNIFFFKILNFFLPKFIMYNLYRIRF